MNTPTPADHDIEAALREALRTDAEQVTPEPALHRILARAHQGERPRRATRRRWLPMVAGAVATAGVVAAAVMVFAPSDEPTRPADPVPCAVEVREGCPVELAVYYARPDLETLVSAGVTVTSSGDVGLDAVQALLDARSHDPFVNPWHGYDTIGPDSGPIAEVNDVTQTEEIVTVDFDRPLTTAMSSIQQSGPSAGRRIIQQLVLTVQSALRTDAPLMITVDGEPAAEAFGVPLAITGTDAVEAQFARWSWVEGIRPASPRQGETLSSPVRFTGQSSTFEATVRWSVTRDGELVNEGFTTGGGFDGYAPYSIKVPLEPGAYTLKLWEPNQASGDEAWTDELFVVYTDFTVE